MVRVGNDAQDIVVGDYSPKAVGANEQIAVARDWLSEYIHLEIRPLSDRPIQHVTLRMGCSFLRGKLPQLAPPLDKGVVSCNGPGVIVAYNVGAAVTDVPDRHLGAE